MHRTRATSGLATLTMLCALLAPGGGGAGGGAPADDGSSGRGASDGSDGADGGTACAAPAVCDGGTPAEVEPTPVTTHPRIFLTQADLPRLRSWATPSNPIWAGGLAKLAAQARRDMDDGNVPAQDDGSDAYTPYPTEA